MKNICENCGDETTLVDRPSAKSGLRTIALSSVYSIMAALLIGAAATKKLEVFYYLVGLGIMLIFLDQYVSYQTFFKSKSFYCPTCDTYDDVDSKSSTKSMGEK